MQVILFKEGAQVCVMSPNDQFEINEVAARDVPHNVPYWIVDSSELPDLSLYPQEAWTLDESITPTGYGSEISDNKLTPKSEAPAEAE